MRTNRELKARIASTKNIQQITTAMKMVAAARLKKAQARLESARPYARKMAEVTLDLAALTPWSFNPLLRKHHYNLKDLIIVFTGDRGLSGDFHYEIADRAVEFGLKLSAKSKVSYYVIGLKGQRRFLEKQVPIFKSFEGPVAGVSFETARNLSKEIIVWYTEEQFDRIYLFYSKFYSALSQKPRSFQLLPIDPAQAKVKEESGLFIFEPTRKKVLDSILPRYLESEIFRAFLETEAGELGARMAAMSAASDNAAEIIAEYQLEFNRIRQTQITNEIAEIVGGAEVLNKESK
ncbi:MAG: ATP synthase F1 subunit gamma [Bacillota bacterium]